MAMVKLSTGFELPWIVNMNSRAVWVNDWRKARSGNSYLSFRNPTSATLPSVSAQTNFSLGFNSTAGESAKVVQRFWVRPMENPSGDVPLFFLVAGTGWYMTAVLKSTRAVQTYNTGNGGTGGAGSTSTVLLTQGDWNKIEVTAVATNGSPVSQNLTVTITNASGQSETLTQNITFTHTNVGFGQVYLLADGLGTFANQSAWIDFDDWTIVYALGSDVATMPALPAHTYHALAYPTAQGSQAQWTGEWEKTLHTQYFSNTILDSVTTSASGQSTTYRVQSASQLGITGAATVGAITLYHTGTRATSGRYDALIDGVAAEFVMSTSAGLNVNLERPFLSSWTGWTQAQFNSLEVGVRTSAAVSHVLFGVHAEVLHDGQPKLPHLQQTGGYRHKWITWTGDGAYSKTISGVGFRPQFVRVFSQAAGSSAVHPMALMDGLPPGMCLGSATSGLEDDAVATMTDDGFMVIKGVSNGLNESGVVYRALCVRDDGDGFGGRRFLTGAFAPTNTAQSFTFGVTPDFQPDLMFIFPERTTVEVMKSTDMGTSATPMSALAPDTDMVPSLDANGFTTGADTAVASSVTASWFAAWKSTDTLMAAGLQHGLVPQNAADQVVNTPGMTPYAVIARGANNAGDPRWRIADSHSGANSTPWTSPAGVVGTSDIIGMNGGSGEQFEINSGGTVFSSTKGCYWVAWNFSLTIGPPTPIVFNPDDIPVGLIWVEAYLPD